MGSSRIFSTPRERKKAIAFMCFLQYRTKNFRKHLAINIPEEKKKDVGGMVFCWLFSQVEVYEILHQTEGSVQQWKEELICKSGLKKSSHVGEVYSGVWLWSLTSRGAREPAKITCWVCRSLRNRDEDSSC